MKAHVSMETDDAGRLSKPNGLQSQIIFSALCKQGRVDLRAENEQRFLKFAIEALEGSALDFLALVIIEQ